MKKIQFLFSFMLFATFSYSQQLTYSKEYNGNTVAKDQNVIVVASASNTDIQYNFEDLVDLSPKELRLKRNEVYARKGLKFKSTDLQEHFEQFEWYYPKHENVDKTLDKLDHENIRKVIKAEKLLKTQIIKKRKSVKENAGHEYSTIKEAKLELKLPNEYWRFSERIVHGNTIVYTYIRDFILDSANRKIDSQISIIIEPVDSTTDVLQYSLLKRNEVPFYVMKMFNHEDGTMKFKYGVGYQGKYEDRGLVHRIYVVHGINNSMGITLIMDTTEGVAKIVTPEFLEILATFDTIN